MTDEENPEYLICKETINDGKNQTVKETRVKADQNINMDFANPMFPSLFGNFDRSSHLFGEAFKQFENDLNKEANMWADSFFPFLMMSPLASMIQPNPMPHLNNSKAF